MDSIRNTVEERVLLAGCTADCIATSADVTACSNLSSARCVFLDSSKAFDRIEYRKLFKDVIR
jgi:hypothetical protein